MSPALALRLARTASLATALAASFAAPARADEPAPSVEALGFARAVPRSMSASRDAPGFGLMMAPRGIRTAGSELALLTWRAGPVTVRPGFYGLIELEGDGDAGFRLWPSQEIHFWRASYALPVAVSFDSLARRLCATCVLEASLQFRHESEHYTGDNGGGRPRDYADRPLYGDALGLDVAWAGVLRGVYLSLRPAVDVFLPGRSSYLAAPSVDLHLRYVGLRGVAPFVSAYAHYRVGADGDRYGYPSAYLLRGLLGVAVPSPLGSLLVFVSGDVGHRAGLAAYTREATLGFGVRLALGRVP